MGWLSWNVGYGRDRKDIILSEVIDKKCVDYIEVKGSNVWTIVHNDNGEKYGILFLTIYKNGEFGYKDIGIEACPYYFNCSKKYYKMIKEIYKDRTEIGHLKEWLEKYENQSIKNKERLEKIKSLKVGDIVKFEYANYGGRQEWRVSQITSKGEVIFEGYKLRGWRKQEFNTKVA